MQVQIVSSGKTITETQASNALGTMTEYWHSLSAQRIQDRYQQQQYKEIYPSSPTDSQNMKLFTDTVAHGEQFSSLPKSISPVGSSFSTSPQSFLDRTINDNCYGNYKKIAAAILTTKESASTLSPSSTQLSSFVAHQAVSLTDSDGVASLPELSEAHGSCSEEEAQAQAQVQALNVTQRLNVPSRAKFFLYEDSDLDSDIGPESIVNTPDNVWVNPLLDQKVEEEHLQDGDCEDYDQHDIDDDDEDFFGKKMPIFSSPKHQSRGSDISSFSSKTSHPTYNALMGRRQSLLSDLLLAEKQQKSQQGSFKFASRCPSASNSDGETAAVHMVVNPMSQGYHAAPQQQHHRRESFKERCDINHFNSHNNVSTVSDRTVSPLVRTKKVYKNLAELANTTRAPNHSESSASLSVSSSPSSSPSSKSSPSPKSLLSSPCAAKTTAAKAATTTTKTERPSIVSTNSFSSCILSKSPSVPTNGWTRTQVQVQIQSLVAQSTSTAQRALLNASTTLTDVLFRTAH
ncbi:hypothetical protein BGX21_001296 [Mortierella sp. AD011]|nr:hypothetical protein BGX21_001296 [Mortierella sp. AD011]